MIFLKKGKFLTQLVPIAVIALSLWPSMIHAAIKTWTGAVNNNWNVPGNWLGGLPNITDDVIFDPLYSANCTINVNVNVRSINALTGYSGFIVQQPNKKINVGNRQSMITGMTFANFGDATFVGSSGNTANDKITILGPLTFNGSFTSTAGILEVASHFYADGDFFHNDGTVLYKYYLHSDIRNKPTFKHLEVHPYYAGNSHHLNILDLITVEGDFILNTSGTKRRYNLMGGDIYALGNIYMNNTAANNQEGSIKSTAATIYITGSNNQTLYGQADPNFKERCRLPNLVIDKDGGILTMQDYIAVRHSYTYIQGTVDPGTSTLILHSSNDISIAGYHAVHNLDLYCPAGTNHFNVTGTLTAQNDLSIYNGGTFNQHYNINNGTIEARGNIYLRNTSSQPTGGTGYILISGGANQTITSVVPENYCRLPNVIVDKSAGDVILNGLVTVIGSLTLNSGKIFSGTGASPSNLLILTNGTTVAGASNSSYVDGAVKKVGNQNFEFPVGKNGSYHPILVSGVAGTTTSAFTAEYFAADHGKPVASLEAPLTQVSQQEYWTLDRNNTSTTAEVSLSYNSSSPTPFLDPCYLRIARWSESAAMWADHGNGGSGVTMSGMSQTIKSNGHVTAYETLPVQTIFTFGTSNQLAAPLGAGLTKLKCEYCGTTVNEMDDLFVAEHVPGATDYEWEFTDQLSGEVLGRTKGNQYSNFAFSYITCIKYNRTYSVRVRALVNGVWGNWGPSCLLSTPPFPSTQLTPEFCGATIYSMADMIAAISVIHAKNYEWRFTDVDNGEVISKVKGNEYSTLILTSLNGNPGLKYEHTYNVEVRAYAGCEWNTIWGPVCQLTFGSFPLTQVKAEDCGMTASSWSEVIYADPVAGAIDYEWRFIDANNNVIQKIKGNQYSNLVLSSVNGLQPGTTYQVIVRANVGGAWGEFGSSCPITTPLTARMAAPGMVINESSGTFAVYPNPSKSNESFYISTGLREASPVSITVFDMLGKKLYSQDFNCSAGEVLNIAPLQPLEHGIYMIEMRAGASTQYQKIIIQD